MRLLARNLLLLSVALAGTGLSLPALAEGAKGGMPQLDPTGYPPQLIWLAITFVLLYLLCWRVLLPRVGRVLEARESRIGGDLAAAERMKQEVEAAIAEYSAAQAKAQGEAQALASATRERLGQAAAAERTALDAQLAQDAKAAEAGILEVKQAALANLREIAAATTIAIVKRLIAADVTPDAAAAAVRDAAEGKR